MGYLSCSRLQEPEVKPSDQDPHIFQQKVSTSTELQSAGQILQLLWTAQPTLTLLRTIHPSFPTKHCFRLVQCPFHCLGTSSQWTNLCSKWVCLLLTCFQFLSAFLSTRKLGPVFLVCPTVLQGQSLCASGHLSASLFPSHLPFLSLFLNLCPPSVCCLKGTAF